MTYLSAVVGITAVYPLLSEAERMVAFLAVSFSTVPCVLIGLRRTAAGARGPWWLLLTALVILNADNVCWYWYVYFQGRPTADGTISGVFAALGQVFVFAGASAVVREFIPALWWLVAALVCSLGGIITVSLLLDPATGARPGWTDMIYLGAYGALGLCGLDRSAVALLRPGPQPVDDLTVGRLAFLGLALAALPIVGGLRQLFGYGVDGPLIAVGAAIVTPLVMLRIGRLSAERSWAEWMLRHRASHDALTGLANRREFTDRLAARLADGRPFLVLFCDLDGFKQVNDRFGHAGGDRLLVEVAARLRRCVHEGDLVSRFGGDEFMILCGDCDAVDLCARVERALAEPIHLDGEPTRVGASIGTVTGESAADVRELIHRADAAMYAAKQGRRDAPGVRAVAA